MNTLPTDWCIEATKENFAELYPWWRANADKRFECFAIGHTLMSSHPDGSCYFSNCIERCIKLRPNYQPITLVQFRQITNPKNMNTHPQKWYIQVTEENMEELNRWRLSVRTESAAKHDRRFGPGCYLLSKYPVDGEGSYFFLQTIEPFPSKFPEYKEITLEQFRQITNSTPNPMPKTIQISRQLLNEYYDAATTPQREYLSEHFKLDGTTTDEAIRELHAMACDNWKPRIKKNHHDCFPEDSKHFDFSGYVANNGINILEAGIGHQLRMSNTFIQIRLNEGNRETHMRSFYLDTAYNWELKQDGSDGEVPVYVLIPTKKLS